MDYKGAKQVSEILREDLYPRNSTTPGGGRIFYPGHLGILEFGTPREASDPRVRYIEISTKYPAMTLNGLARAGLMETQTTQEANSNPRLRMLFATGHPAGVKLILEDLNETSV